MELDGTSWRSISGLSRGLASEYVGHLAVRAPQVEQGADNSGCRRTQWATGGRKFAPGS